MNWRRVGKISLYILLGLVLLASSVLGYIYYDNYGKYRVDEAKYEHYTGHLDNSSDFSRCSDVVVGWFASAATYMPIYRASKTDFKNYIQEHFLITDKTINGFLNLRFIINCHGEVGDMEINQLDKDYRPVKFPQKLVDQLIKLSSRKENWEVPTYEEPKDLYMYLIYKIEDGKIVEILP